MRCLQRQSAGISDAAPGSKVPASHHHAAAVHSLDCNLKTEAPGACLEEQVAVTFQNAPWQPP